MNSSDSSVVESHPLPRDAAPIIVIMELIKLTADQRIIFSVFVFMFLICAIISNTATLFTGVRSRKIRPFFRTCLICLATSDLLSSVFSGVTYLSQYSGSYVQVWRLGSVMCSLSPFMSTVSVLANSITLVAIAVDRYLSVIKLMRNVWETRGIYCLFFAIIIWGLSIGIAVPTLNAFKYMTVYAVQLDPHNSSVIISAAKIDLCAAGKMENARYYMTLLLILFIPIGTAFIWFNSVLAWEIWNRRKAMNRHSRIPASSAVPQDSGSIQQTNKTVSTIMTISKSTTNPKQSVTVVSNGPGPKRTVPSGSTRDGRHLRMFSIIILLMVMFIVFRMPVWIYLILKFYNTYTDPVHWILQYSFGILSLFGCALNPFLYAFLTQTINYASIIYKKALGCCGLRKLFVRGATTKSDVAISMPGSLAGKMEIYIVATNK